MVSGRDGTIRIGVLQASPNQLTQIEAWVADFHKARAEVETATTIGLDRFDIYLIIVEQSDTLEADLGSYVVQAAFAPCLILATQDDETMVDVALAAGATEFFSLPSLNAVRLERAILFSLARRKVVDVLTARESCLAAARERDRQKLASALHDGPLQDLIGARFLLGALESGISVDDVQNSLQQVINAVRALCSDLKPPALGPFGLEKAIRAHMQLFQAQNEQLVVTLELDVDHQLLPEWARLALFRVYQAALANVVQHAQASHLWVRMRLDEEHLRLTIADDGQGFEPPASWLEFASAERCGLLMMQERVDALQGRMMVQSSPGSGTRIMVQVPIEQAAQPLPTYLSPAASERNE